MFSLKTLCLVFIIQIFAIYGAEQSYMIKNKKSLMVLDGAKQLIEIGPWENKNTQLWTVHPSGTPGYSIIQNVGNGKVLDACPVTKALLSWPKHGNKNQRWRLDANGDERLQVQHYSNDFLMHKDTKPVLDVSKQSDESDKWLLVEPIASDV